MSGPEISVNSDTSSENLSNNALPLGEQNIQIDNFANCQLAQTFKIICHNCKDLVDSNSINYVSENLDLDSYLKTTYRGNLVLSYYTKYKSLSDNLTNYVSELVVQREILSILKSKKATSETPLKRLE